MLGSFVICVSIVAIACDRNSENPNHPTVHVLQIHIPEKETDTPKGPIEWFAPTKNELEKNGIIGDSIRAVTNARNKMKDVSAEARDTLGEHDANVQQAVHDLDEVTKMAEELPQKVLAQLIEKDSYRMRAMNDAVNGNFPKSDNVEDEFNSTSVGGLLPEAHEEDDQQTSSNEDDAEEVSAQPFHWRNVRSRRGLPTWAKRVETDGKGRQKLGRGKKRGTASETEDLVSNEESSENDLGDGNLTDSERAIEEDELRQTDQRKSKRRKQQVNREELEGLSMQSQRSSGSERFEDVDEVLATQKSRAKGRSSRSKRRDEATGRRGRSQLRSQLKRKGGRSETVIDKRRKPMARNRSRSQSRSQVDTATDRVDTEIGSQFDLDNILDGIGSGSLLL